MEESGQPRLVWGQEQAIMAGASSNLAIQTIKYIYIYETNFYM